ncbi:MAG TPA: hypothetical protein VFA45_08620, partial [Actinomycetes bacterium]|nr:hypothetical protein [Actinomycetes bacterium]
RSTPHERGPRGGRAGPMTGQHSPWRAALRADPIPALLAPRFEEFDELAAGLGRLAATPTLLAWADHDLLLPRRELRRLQRALPAAASRTVRQAGHFLPEEPARPGHRAGDRLSGSRRPQQPPAPAGP